MNLKIRRFIGYWFMLLFGIALLCLQFKKYMCDELNTTLEGLTLEFFVTCVAVLMVLRPLGLLEILETIVKSKYGKASDE